MMLVAYRGCELQRRLAPDVSSARGGTHFGVVLSTSCAARWHALKSSSLKRYISLATLALS